MTVLDQVRAFIVGRKPEATCDDCIASRLQLTVRQHANHKTRELAKTTGFDRRGGLSAALAAGGEKPKRNSVNRQLTPIRLLRNRIAHHEPILHLNLPRHRQSALDLTNACAPALAEWTKAHCAFDRTYDAALAQTFLTRADEDAPDA